MGRKSQILLFLVTNLMWGQPTGRSIIEKMDQLKQPIDVKILYKMTLISTKDGKERRRSRELTRIEKKYEDGTFKSKLLLRFSQPKEITGTGFLMWDRIGSDTDDQWLFIPKLRKVKRIRPNEKNRSFMGTDFSYEDLSERDINDDIYEMNGEEISNGTICYKVIAKPKKKGVQYGSRIIWVDKQNSLMKRVEFINKKGELYKILDFPEHVKNRDYWTATKMIMKNLKNNHRTELTMLNIEYDLGLKDNVFTERFLKRN